jgi:hypothetical protein
VRTVGYTETRGYCLEAVLCFLTGLISIVGVLLVGEGGIQGITALILAFIASKEIKEKELKGRKLVILGVICSIIGLLSYLF